MNPLAKAAFIVFLPSVIIGGLLYVFVICRDLGIEGYWDSYDFLSNLKLYRKSHFDDPNAIGIYRLSYVLDSHKF